MISDNDIQVMPNDSSVINPVAMEDLSLDNDLLLFYKGTRIISNCLYFIYVYTHTYNTQGLINIFCFHKHLGTSFAVLFNLLFLVNF